MTMKVINWLVVGTGDIACKRVIPAIMSEERSNLAAVCDVVESRATEVAKQYNSKSYTDLNIALKDKDINAVYLATPVCSHVQQSIGVIKAGKHLIVEKPLAVSYLEAQQLAHVARNATSKCAVAYFRRFSDRYRMAKEMVQKKEFGQIVLIRLSYASWFNPLKEDPKYWRVIPEKSGGGPLSDMGTHMFDVMIGLFGLPERVFAKVETLTHSYKVEDSAVAVMKYANGTQVIASFHWNSQTWNHEFEVIGTQARIEWHPYDGANVVKMVGRDAQDIPMPNHQNVHYPLIKDFVTCIFENRQPENSIDESIKTNLLLDAIYASARKGAEVLIKEVQ
jgi:1,5-anhydro-D-fructose reductase (1,5-anhydro-D-mannitol-forming)